MVMMVQALSARPTRTEPKQVSLNLSTVQSAGLVAKGVARLGKPLQKMRSAGRALRALQTGSDSACEAPRAGKGGPEPTDGSGSSNPLASGNELGSEQELGSGQKPLEQITSAPPAGVAPDLAGAQGGPAAPDVPDAPPTPEPAEGAASPPGTDRGPYRLSTPRPLPRSTRISSAEALPGWPQEGLPSLLGRLSTSISGLFTTSRGEDVDPPDQLQDAAQQPRLVHQAGGSVDPLEA